MGFSIPTQAWKSNRRKIHSLLTQSKFQLFLENSKEGGQLPYSGSGLLSQQATEYDLQDVLHRFSFNNMCLIVLGFDPQSLSFQFSKVAVKNAFNVLEEIVFIRHMVPRSIWKLQRWLQIGQEKRLTQAQIIVDQFLYERNRCSEDDHLITAYIEEEEKEQKGHKFVRDSAFSLLAAGRATLSATLTWFFWIVATHPSVEAKILEEIKANLGSKEADWRILGINNEVGKQVYLHAAICESLRLFLPIPYLHLCATNPDILPSGHPINLNTKIFYYLYAMGRVEETCGEDCLEFKPERWIGEGGGIKNIPSYKFITFSSGSSTSLGKDMGIIEMKMVATSMIWNFHIKVLEGHPVSPSIFCCTSYGTKPQA
ncbi:Cytochrome P450 family protein [Quillaja saponaria]|uniref:Cytochrome P450 family protein n=1 Tax=Quillaja saponaria TaxID=32244 RepID=A0AAD7M737_QUISA|nr:Cytochrome P450 family protein [Quillaja saponaria]